MNKLLLVVATIICAGCNGNPNGIGTSAANGTYAPYTGATVGPGWHQRAGMISIRDAHNTEVARMTTDSTGHGTIDLAPATYQIQPLPDTVMLKPHTVTIQSGQITRDTINYCPFCV